MRRAAPQPVEQAAVPYEMITLPSLGAFMLFGSIDECTSFTACEFIIKANLLQPRDAALTFFINSEGGNSHDGFAIIDVMETSRLPVQTVGTGLIASMALLVMVTGHKGTRTITKNTEVMAHQFTSELSGKMHELLALTDECIRLEQTFIEHFKRHTFLTEKQIRDVLLAPSDRWLSPLECKKLGLCDRVTEFLEVPKLVKKTLRRSKQ